MNDRPLIDEDLILRCAQALYEVRRHPSQPPWDDVPHSVQNLYLRDAKTVLDEALGGSH